MQQNKPSQPTDHFAAPLIMNYKAAPQSPANLLPNAVNNGKSPQHLLQTTSDQTASIIPEVLPLSIEQNPESVPNANDQSATITNAKSQPITNMTPSPQTLVPKQECQPQPVSADTTTTTTTTTDDNVVTAAANPTTTITDPSSNAVTNAATTATDATTEAAKESRWTKDNRVILKQLMGSLPPHDIGAALRVILDTFGVESSKLVRRGNYVELDLSKINDDYILDSLWNYCAQMQYNIMNTLQAQQQQQIQQQLQFQQMQQQQVVQQVPMAQPVLQMSPQRVQPMMQQVTPVQMQQVQQPFMREQQQTMQTMNGMVMPVTAQQMRGNAENMNQQFIVMDPARQMQQNQQ